MVRDERERERGDGDVGVSVCGSGVYVDGCDKGKIVDVRCVG